MRDEKTIIGGDYVPVYDRLPAAGERAGGGE